MSLNGLKDLLIDIGLLERVERPPPPLDPHTIVTDSCNAKEVNGRYSDTTNGQYDEVIEDQRARAEGFCGLYGSVVDSFRSEVTPSVIKEATGPITTVNSTFHCKPKPCMTLR